MGFASNRKLAGRHLLVPCRQMHNRGNGKGGGIVAVGLDHEQMKVSKEVLRSHYILQVAYLDDKCKKKVESSFITSVYDVDSSYEVESKDDPEVHGLEVRPPRVFRYFVKPKKNKLNDFMKKSGLKSQKAEEEYVFKNSLALNDEYYHPLGEKRAFVLSHGRDLVVFKIVGYAEQAITYYGLTNMRANIWMGHQRYPTKGVVWHPGGAHPFIGLNDALVHNGDFANYFGIKEYLRQRGRKLQFLTDTEAAAQLFDLYMREYEYPLEYVIEALAPTTERDYQLLPQDKKEVYSEIQKAHIHASPDGPWFFIIAKTDVESNSAKLIGITDPSMLRPQVFALLNNGSASIGLVASEKQAIDATLESISQEDGDFLPIADSYWNARGGSHTDGGAFIFTVKDGKLSCTNKFGDTIDPSQGKAFSDPKPEKAAFTPDIRALRSTIVNMSYGSIKGLFQQTEAFALRGDKELRVALSILTKLQDQRYPVGGKKRSAILTLLKASIARLLSAIPKDSRQYGLIDSPDQRIPKPYVNTATLVIDASKFEPEGEQGVARVIPEAYGLGFRNFILFNMSGQRFVGVGLGPHDEKVTIDVYGSSGDYLGSGIQSMEICVHGNAQDQLGQIMHSGKLIIYGDVGQTFLYGAKGGECYIMGNAAGRPMINAVGNIKAIINGTCLDYLAESFMAGDPLNGGGFAIVNGVTFDDEGVIIDLETPYPGSNLFSLSSGGAIYVRDPHMKLSDSQLNGGRFEPLSPDDWVLIEPYLKENEDLFGVSIERLLTVDGKVRYPEEVYRKVTVAGESEH